MEVSALPQNYSSKGFLLWILSSRTEVSGCDVVTLGAQSSQDWGSPCLHPGRK